MAGLIAALAVTLTVSASGDAEAQRRQVPQSRAETQLSFAPVVKLVTPAVVNVFVKSRVRGVASPFANDPFFRRFFGERFGMPESRVQNSLGSGVIVSSGGLIVTNTHVVKSRGTAEIRVVLSDKREFSANVILQDEKTDIAVLQVEGLDERLPFLEFADSDAAEVGDLVLAIGNPFGVGQTVTSGIVSALARTRIGRSDDQVFIQTDAAINPGNSGGALVDMTGRLVGINTAIYSRSGGSNGIGFAIPANLVRLYVDSASTGRAIERPWTGASLSDVGRDIAASLGLDRVAGAIVTRVSRGSPAAKSGLRVGDVITAVDGREVADARSARYRLTTAGVGGRVELDILRDGRALTVRLPLVAIPPLERDDVRNLSGNHPLDGARVANLVPAIADQIDMPEGDGVVILKVIPGSYAASLGLRPRDVILELDGARIEAIADLEQALSGQPRYWELAVRRGDRVFRVRVPI